VTEERRPNEFAPPGLRQQRGRRGFLNSLLASRTFAFFCGLKIFERFFSEAPDEKGEFGVCDNLPRRQHEVMAEKMRGCF
jgi:hypothetical protein